MAFTGKVVLITGSSSGIGAETAIHFAREGARVIITGKNNDRLARVEENILKENDNKVDNIFSLIGDLRDDGFLNKLVEDTLSKFGQIDVLVNNAGVAHMTPLGSETTDKLDEMYTVNVRAAFRLSNLCYPHLIKTKGCIVNNSSMTGTVVSPHLCTGYHITKAALDHLTRNFAYEMAPKGVRVNAVAPGNVHTNLTRNLPQEFKDNMDGYFETCHPMPGELLPTDCAEAIVFLAGNKARNITGVVLPVDAGGVLVGLPII